MSPLRPCLVLSMALMFSSLTADEASRERRWIASPDNRFLLTFSGPNPSMPDAWNIQDALGKVLYSSRDCPALKDVVEYRPESVLWSPDSNAFAFAAGYSKLLGTYVFVHGPKGFAFAGGMEVLEHYDNPHLLPVKWLKNGTLKVNISGPYAGKAGLNGHYKGEATLRVTVDPPKCEIISQRIHDFDPS